MLPNPENDAAAIRTLKQGRYRIDFEQGLIWSTHWNRLVKGTLNSFGYVRVCIQESDKKRYVGYHRIIWIAAHGPIPADMTIDHINGVKTDNRLKNLRLLTIGDNIRAAAAMGLRPVGENHGRAVLTDAEVAEIRVAYSAGGESWNGLARRYGVSKRQVGKIIRGELRVLKAPASSGEHPIPDDAGGD